MIKRLVRRNGAMLFPIGLFLIGVVLMFFPDLDFSLSGARFKEEIPEENTFEESSLGLQMRSKGIVFVASTDKLFHFDEAKYYEDELVLIVASFSDAMLFLPEEAVAISITCWNLGYPLLKLTFRDVQLIEFAISLCSEKDAFWMSYGYPPEYEPEQSSDPLG